MSRSEARYGLHSSSPRPWSQPRSAPKRRATRERSSSGKCFGPAAESNHVLLLLASPSISDFERRLSPAQGEVPRDEQATNGLGSSLWRLPRRLEKNRNDRMWSWLRSDR